MLINKLKRFINEEVQRVLDNMINENVSSIVYHWATPRTAANIVAENRFVLMSTLFKQAEQSQVGASHNNIYYMSLTRNGKIGMGGYSNKPHSWVRFTLDGDKINSRFHTKAIDYWGPETGKSARLSGADGEKIQKDGYETESEDRLYSKKPIIENALSYVKQIDVYVANPESAIDALTIRKYFGNVKVYNSVEDFNRSKNEMEFDKILDLANQKTFSYSDVDNDYKDMDKGVDTINFLTSIVYLVNMPQPTLENCILTLRKYSLDKYIKSVINCFKKNRNLYDLTDNIYGGLDGRNFKNLLSRLYSNIEIGWNVLGVKRNDLSNSFRILTDFCQKRKLGNFNAITNYFLYDYEKYWDEKYESNKDQMVDYQKTVNVTTFTFEDDNNYYFCYDLNKEKIDDLMLDDGILDDIYTEIKRGIDPDTTKSGMNFDKYLRYFLFKKRPTVQEVIDLYDKLEEKGNRFENNYKPIIKQLQINGLDVEDLSRRRSIILPDDKIIVRGKGLSGDTIIQWFNQK